MTARRKQSKDQHIEAQMAAELKRERRGPRDLPGRSRAGGRVAARMDAMKRADAAVPLCGPDDLAVVVSWERDGTGLRGQVIAENVGGRACRLAGKPSITALRRDGSPLSVSTTTSLELLEPGYVIVRPGGRAAAPVSWASCCGHQASDRARVDWPGGSTVAQVRGPTQPECVEGRTDNLTSYWFSLMD